jgi:hypothetical protein
MARTRYIQDPKTHQLIPADEYYGQQDNTSAYIMADYQPYKSMVTGEMIDGRKAHREHLKRHNLVVAEQSSARPQKPDGGRLKEQLARQVYEKLRYK